MGQPHVALALLGIQALEYQNYRLSIAEALYDSRVEQLTCSSLQLLCRDASRQQGAHLLERKHRATLLDDALGKARGPQRIGAHDQQQAAGRVAHAIRWSKHPAARGDVDRARRRVALTRWAFCRPSAALVGADLDAAHRGGSRHSPIIPYRASGRFARSCQSANGSYRDRVPLRIGAIVILSSEVEGVRWT